MTNYMGAILLVSLISINFSPILDIKAFYFLLYLGTLFCVYAYFACILNNCVIAVDSLLEIITISKQNFFLKIFQDCT